MKYKKAFIAQIASLILVVALFAVYLASRGPRADTFIVAPISATSSLPATGDAIAALPLINPAVMANLGKHYIINFLPLREKLVSLQNAQKNKTFVYFIYLNNASWIGLNEKDLFTAASTIKVPLAMAIYRLAEQGKLNMADTYTLSQLDLDDNFGTLYQAGADKAFTIEELVGIMLRYSDNTAARALLHVTQLLGVSDPFADVYNAMGWQKVEFGNKPAYIDINEKTLSNMFIALYNASYINPADSQKILNYLDESEFNEQIVAGVPAPISVAHKIGIDAGDNTYSDCGIVYAPSRPYVLCLGTQGMSQVQADAFMKAVSQEVYSYVIKN